MPDNITTSVVAVGTPPHQLEAVFQSVLVAPIQVPEPYETMFAVLLAEMALEQLPDARLVIVTVVVPELAKMDVVNVPVPATDTVIVAVEPVAALGALRLYVTV